MNNNVKHLLNELERELNMVPESYKIFNAKRSIKNIRKSLDIKGGLKDLSHDDIMESYAKRINDMIVDKTPERTKWKNKEAESEWWKLNDEESLDDNKIDELLEESKTSMKEIMEKAVSFNEMKRVSDQMNRRAMDNAKRKKAGLPVRPFPPTDKIGNPPE